ncbi:hypothetical protein JCM19294_2266 [Nonlabens tegetincola]|uniref:Uncharacterized protein n=1 Tax=Nonlabens tegetincola TaxID=323273 RepID=A0A090PXD9_9FLAO|nr:hypothetical protein JCM19294_2266 [Nonlabens tegetincola]
MKVNRNGIGVSSLSRKRIQKNYINSTTEVSLQKSKEDVSVRENHSVGRSIRKGICL